MPIRRDVLCDLLATFFSKLCCDCYRTQRRIQRVLNGAYRLPATPLPRLLPLCLCCRLARNRARRPQRLRTRH